jgi:hypothetical protein
MQGEKKRSEVGDQRAEVRGRKPEIRGQRSEVSRQRTGFRGRRGSLHHSPTHPLTHSPTHPLRALRGESSIVGYRCAPPDLQDCVCNCTRGAIRVEDDAALVINGKPRAGARGCPERLISFGSGGTVQSHGPQFCSSRKKSAVPTTPSGASPSPVMSHGQGSGAAGQSPQCCSSAKKSSTPTSLSPVLSA